MPFQSITVHATITPSMVLVDQRTMLHQMQLMYLHSIFLMVAMVQGDWRIIMVMLLTLKMETIILAVVILQLHIMLEIIILEIIHILMVQERFLIQFHHITMVTYILMPVMVTTIAQLAPMQRQTMHRELEKTFHIQQLCLAILVAVIIMLVLIPIQQAVLLTQLVALERPLILAILILLAIMQERTHILQLH